jgi:aspartate kinase
VTRVDIASTRMLMAYGFLRRVFEVFERFRTPVDVVTTSEVSVSVTVDDTRALDAILGELSVFADVSREDGLAIVCAVGERLRTDARLATRVLGALEGLPLAMVSQGGSRKNITVVLRDADAPAAMERLHRRFFGSEGASAGRGALAIA